MKTVNTLRLENARILAKNYKNLAEFSRVIGREPTQVSRFMGTNPTKNIGDKIARDIERICRKEEGWLDADHEVQGTAKQAAYADAITPLAGAQFLLATGAAEIEWEDIDNEAARKEAKVIACPVPHSNNTYATRIMDESMSAPYGATYPKGSMIFIDPERAHEAKSGDRVIAQLEGGHITFRQLNEFDGKPCLQALNTTLHIPPTYTPFKVLGLVIGAWFTEQQLVKK